MTPAPSARHDDDHVPSPCVRLCTVDETTLMCVGCLRTVEEIKAWRGLSPDGKRALLTVLDGRRSAGTRPSGVNPSGINPPGVTPRG